MSRAHSQKRVLCLFGNKVDCVPRIVRYLDGDAELEIKSLLESEQENFVLGKNYDQIVINAHGTYDGRSDGTVLPNVRRNHHVLIDENRLINTMYLIEHCAAHTKKIFIDSCFSGVVAKDLAPGKLDGVELVTVAGSKHQTLPNPTLFALEKKFLANGVDGLLEFATKNYPETVVIKDAEGDFSKLSSTKFTRDGQLERRFSILNSGKWERGDGVTFSPDTLEQRFKDVAFAAALQKNKIDDARRWQLAGADVNAKIFGDNHSLVFCAAVDGDSELLRRLWVIDEVEKDATKIIFFAAEKMHREVCDFLLSNVDEKKFCDEIGLLPDIYLGKKAPGFLFQRAIELDKRGIMKVLINKLSTEELQENFHNFIEKNSRELAEFLLPIISERFAELSKENPSHTEKSIISKQKKSFHQDVERCVKNGWSVAEEHRGGHVSCAIM